MSNEPEKYAHAFRVSYAGADQITEQGAINATWFAWWLSGLGWSKNAICAALGNWEVETLLNPNYPQNAQFPATRTGGFGMPHWTPWYDKIGAWALNQYGLTATNTDDNPLADFVLQMEYHYYDATRSGGGWLNRGGYSYSFKEWTKSHDDPETLADAYYWQYERSAAGGSGNRPDRARKWFDYFTDNPYPRRSSFPKWLLFQFNATNQARLKRRW